MYGAKDLTGIKFGKLTAVEPTEKRYRNYVVWRCMCECGNECWVDSKRLQRGTITNCGCIKKTNNRNGSIPLDLKGEVFGNLTVLNRAEAKGTRTAWICECECGNKTVVTTHDLRAGKVRSCGCKAHSEPYYINLKGQKFGYLTVREKTDMRDYKGSILWKCHCECGNDILYSASALMYGNIKSCGCYRKNNLCKRINETLHHIDGTCIERLNVQKPRSDNKSGHVGIHKVNENQFRAYIGFKGKRYYLGTFNTLEDAINARQRGEQIHIEFLNQYYQENDVEELTE